jgi:hypothetical protein
VRATHAFRRFLCVLTSSAVVGLIACGARSELWSPAGGAGGRGPTCTDTEVAAVSASIGGGIHHVYTECFGRYDTTSCPVPDEAIHIFTKLHCSSIDQIECGPIVKPNQCCYVALETCALT